MTLLALLIGALVLDACAAACPDRLRDWVDRGLRSRPSLHGRCVRFLDRLLSDLDRRYPLGIR